MTDAGQLTQFNKIDVPAAPENAAQLRHEFSHWLRTCFTLDAVKASDVVLAVNEALANAAEFAYVSAPQPGVLQLKADYDRDTGTLTVIIADQGSWRVNDRAQPDPARGRGIPLMHALADRAVIDSNGAGTEVRLQWDRIDGCETDGSGRS